MDEVYLLVGASEARLLREADRTDYELELDKSRCVEGGLRLGMRLPKLADQRGQLNREFDIRSWGRIYGRYDGLNQQHPWRHKLYLRHNEGPLRHPDTIFRTVDRIRYADSFTACVTLEFWTVMMYDRML